MPVLLTIANECQATSQVRATGSEGHLTREYHSPMSTSCCSKDHKTNDPSWPGLIPRETAIISKRPDELSPYYTTYERWTWGIDNTTPPPHNAASPGTAQDDDPTPLAKKGTDRPTKPH